MSKYTGIVRVVSEWTIELEAKDEKEALSKLSKTEVENNVYPDASLYRVKDKHSHIQVHSIQKSKEQ